MKEAIAFRLWISENGYSVYWNDMWEKDRKLFTDEQLFEKRIAETKENTIAFVKWTKGLYGCDAEEIYGEEKWIDDQGTERTGDYVYKEFKKHELRELIIEELKILRS